MELNLSKRYTYLDTVRKKPIASYKSLYPSVSISEK